MNTTTTTDHELPQPRDGRKPPFAGRTALVTGASRGIGRAIAERLAADGALVAVHYGSDADAAKLVVDQIGRAGGMAFALGADLALPDAPAELWAGFDALVGGYTEREGVDILVNNAAYSPLETIDQTTIASFDRLVAVNTRAPFFIVQHGLRRLVDGGRIINISSGVNRVSTPFNVAYSVSKGSIDTLTLALATLLGPRGITVNSVAPGLVGTDATTPFLDGFPEAARGIIGSTALGRIGDPADVADVVAFLASTGGRWVTGQVVDASGGFHL